MSAGDRVAYARPPIETLPDQLRIIPLSDSIVETRGHWPDDPYIAAVWLGIAGPTATWCWHTLAGYAHQAGPDGLVIDRDDLAGTLGVAAQGRLSQLARAVNRMGSFDLARRTDETITVRLALPDVPARMADRLTATAADYHTRTLEARKAMA